MKLGMSYLLHEVNIMAQSISGWGDFFFLYVYTAER